MDLVNIVVIDTKFGAVSGDNGYYIIQKLPAGNYNLRFSFIGYETFTTNLLKIEAGKTTNLNVYLREKPIEFNDPIVVTPGRFTVEKTESTAPQILSRSEIEEMPHIGEDIYRAVQILPGLASNDFTSQFHIRGGEEDEVLVRMDGMELYKPFHIRDFEGGAVSAINAKLIKKVELLMGGYPSEFGDKMSGVFDITTIDRQDMSGKFSAAIGLTTAECLFGGKFGEKGSYLLSLRRGYVDIALDIIKQHQELSPDYYDIYGKYRYLLNDNHRISFNYFRISDRFLWDKDDLKDNFDTKYYNDYMWTSWQYIPNQKFYNRTVFSYVRGDHARYIGFDPERERVIDFQDFNVIGLKNDAMIAVNDKNILKIGFDIKRYSTSYDYFETDERELPGIGYYLDTTSVVISPSGNKFDFYIQDKFFVTEKTALNVGLRYDYQEYMNKSQFSPRIGLAYNLSKDMVLRGAWGYYYQSQEMADLEVSKGITKFDNPEYAQHYVLGWEYQPTQLFNIRVESYYKYFGKLIDRIYDRKNRMYLYPDKGYANGIELLVRRQHSRKLSWWFGYSLSFTKEKLQDRYIFRDFDQRHSVILNFNYIPAENWNINVGWKYHTGFRYTSRYYLKTSKGGWKANYSEVNESKYPSFHKLDIKLSHNFLVRRKNLLFNLSFFIEVYNLY
ncbi:TonB-dependent receptor domain-containing protein, partial [candidate division KSB1 bacterium]